MKVIRHLCNGHEYRYDTEEGTVTNNYGTVVSVLRFEKFIPDTVNSIATLYRVDKAGNPIGNCFASLRNEKDPSKLAQFAIGHTALHFPET